MVIFSIGRLQNHSLGASVDSELDRGVQSGRIGISDCTRCRESLPLLTTKRHLAFYIMARNKKNELKRDGLAPAFEKRVYDWRDKYVTRIERDMTTAFPQLEKALMEGVEKNLGLILKNKAKQFSSEVIEPEVSSWIERTMTPIRDDAAKELAEVTFKYGEILEEEFDVSQLKLMLLPAGMGLAGLGLIIGGFLVGITTGTFLFFWASASVSWPVLLGAAAVGTVLLATGTVQLSHLKNKVAKAFTKTFIPKLHDCLIGKGFKVKGENHDSLCRQFQEAVEQTAEEILTNQKPTSV